MSKPKEVVNIHIGQAGLRIGDYCCRLFANEHKINTPDEIANPFFDQNEKGKTVPNSVFVDLEPFTINNIRTGSSRELYDETCFINGLEDGACNYARGYYLIDETILDNLEDKIRQITETKKNLQGFLVTHSTGGGTGSGFATRIMEKISDTYHKKTKISFSVLPGEKMATSPMEIYNTVLFLHKTMDHFDVSFLFDNDAVRDICSAKFKIGYPEFSDMNEVISQVISSITASVRFDGGMNKLLKEFPSTSAPYPRLKFPIAAYAPLVEDTNNLNGMSAEILKAGNQMVSVDLAAAKSITCCYLYRGGIEMSDANRTIKYIKSKKILNFASMPFETYKVSVIKKAAVRLPGSRLPSCVEKKSVCVLVNGSSVCETWSHLIEKHKLLRKEQAYVHWLAEEGLDDSVLEDAEDDLKLLSNEYLDILSGD